MAWPKSAQHGHQSYPTGYQYDAGGRLATVTYPSGRLISYTFDGNGRISGISTTFNGTTTVLASQVQYQPFGRLQSLVFGNGQTYARTCDLDGRMTSYTLNGAVQTVSYDAASRLTGIVPARRPVPQIRVIRTRARGFEISLPNMSRSIAITLPTRVRVTTLALWLRPITRAI